MPAPFSPMISSRSPRATWNPMSSNTGGPPYPFASPSASSTIAPALGGSGIGSARRVRGSAPSRRAPRACGRGCRARFAFLARLTVCPRIESASVFSRFTSACCRPASAPNRASSARRAARYSSRSPGTGRPVAVQMQDPRDRAVEQAEVVADDHDRPRYPARNFISQCLASLSRWFVGSSRSSRSEPRNRIRVSSSRRRSPPESARTGRSSRSSGRPSPAAMRRASASPEYPPVARYRSSSRVKRATLVSVGRSSIARRNFSRRSAISWSPRASRTWARAECVSVSRPRGSCRR